jgi:hypothetical protein
LARGASAPVSLGVRAAVASTSARALVAASVAAVTAVLATVVFSTSLTGLIANPERFGWPYDAAVMVGFGFGGADRAAIGSSLDRPEVRTWQLASVSGGYAVDGEPVPTVAELEGFDALPLPVVEGRLPVADDEIALGTRTAGRLGLDVGDTAVVSNPFGGKRSATVRALVVLPPIGTFEGDRASPGTGAFLPARFFAATISRAEREGGPQFGDRAEEFGSFVVIDLRDGVDTERFLASIRDETANWEVDGERAFPYPAAVRPAAVADVAAMRSVPVTLAGLVALAMAVGLALGIAVATRTRRRELAVLRTLGCTGRQLRATVRWHALTVIGIGLVAGLPLGTALGRALYRVFATRLGVLAEAAVSLRSTLLVVAATIVMGLLAAAGPAHRASRVVAAEALRDE